MKTGAHSPGAEASEKDGASAPRRVSGTRRIVSDTALRNAKPQAQAYKITIADGLYLEVMPSGSKLWRLKYRLDNKENRFAIGSYPEVSLREARDAAESARKQIRQGIHPARQRKIERLQAMHENACTLEAIAAEWIAMRPWEPVTKRRRLDMLQRVVFPKLGALPVKDIAPAMILDVLKQAATRNGLSVMAEAKRTLFGIFELATETFRVEANPVHRWREALPKNKTQHKRPLSKEEIGELLRAVDEHKGSHQILFAFRLMWLTLARPAEVVEAEWQEFDLDAAVWRIPAQRMKARREHVVPLPRQAIEILRTMFPITGDRQHVFPHRDDRRKPMVTASFRQMLHVVGWSGRFSPHATRTTASTRLNELNYRSDWIERQLAHADPNAVRRTYNHADYFEGRAEMMQTWADMLDQWTAGTTNVLPLKRRAAA